jgi:hypothetical protein
LLAEKKINPVVIVGVMYGEKKINVSSASTRPLKIHIHPTSSRHETKSCDLKILCTSSCHTQTATLRLPRHNTPSAILNRSSCAPSEYYDRLTSTAASLVLGARPSYHSALRRLQVLPQIRSLFILSDCLGLVDQRLAGTDGYLTVARFCEIVQLGEARCIEIGRYQLHGMFGKFEFADRRLRLMWPEIQNKPDDRDAY